ncbi:MAG TPA: putative Ig domain-containing protein [Armatimonadota bacterium]|nr:putative Ig domain-containing protein [Armatimonadota bacterium]
MSGAFDSSSVLRPPSSILRHPSSVLRPSSFVLLLLLASAAYAAPFKLPPFPPPPATPEIHGASVIGASPGRPFLFLIPATGKEPLIYSADHLPPGLSLDPHSGIITGAVTRAGSYPFHVGVTGPAGKDVRELTVICGDHVLALTPPMGWDTWNAFGDTATADDVRAQADWMVKSGLAAHGYQYIIIDDTWEGRRDAAGQLGASLRFGDIKSLADYVHAKGLKLGIYSAATPQTCSGFAGSAGHEAQDAALFASWGVDYLRYDWCPEINKGSERSQGLVKAAFVPMAQALDTVPRDIVFAINSYGAGNPENWAAKLGANSWGISTAVLDRWDIMSKDGFAAIDDGGRAGPSHWNDPGWLMVGRTGFADPRFPHLTPSEQMWQVSLWSMMAAPLILSCDLSQLDPNKFYPITSTLLMNDDVLAIDQDSLGKPATTVWNQNPDDTRVLSRPLADGTTAVGLFNNRGWTATMKVTWSNLHLTGPQPVRDLWARRDLGVLTDSYITEVPGHGVVLLKIGRPR